MYVTPDPLCTYDVLYILSFENWKLCDDKSEIPESHTNRKRTWLTDLEPKPEPEPTPQNSLLSLLQFFLEQTDLFHKVIPLQIIPGRACYFTCCVGKEV